MHISLFLGPITGDTAVLAEAQTERVEALTERYDDLIQHLKHYSAIDVLKELLEIFPLNEMLLVRYAYLNEECFGRTSVSLACLEAILHANPEHEEALTLRIELNWKLQSNFETIISDATALLALTPDVTNCFALYHRARAYVLSNQAERASEDFNQLLCNSEFLLDSDYKSMRVNLRYDRALILYHQYQLTEEPHKLEEITRELSLIIDEEYGRSSKDEDFDKALLLRSQMYGKQAAFALELEDLNVYLQRHPRAVDVLDRRIAVNTMLGNDDEVILDRYAIYKITHTLTQVQQAQAVLFWAESQSMQGASSGKKRAIGEAVTNTDSLDIVL